MSQYLLRSTGSILLLCVLVFAAEGQMRSNKFGVGASGSYFYLNSDFDKASPSFGGGAELSYSIAEYVSIRSSMGFGFLQAKNNAGGPSLSTALIFGNLSLAVDMSPSGEFNPFIYAGASGFYFDPRTGDGTPLAGANDKLIKGTVVGGLGFDWFWSEFVSLTVAAEAGLPVTDRLDGLSTGTQKDLVGRVSIGLRYYFFDQDFITRMLKALEERYK